MQTAVTPVPESDRFQALDVLRGCAVLGILVMNIQWFAMPFAAYLNPTALGEPSTRDFVIWSTNHLFDRVLQCTNRSLEIEHTASLPEFWPS